MNKTGLIIKREYLRRVSKKSFLLLTFLAPFLFAAMVFVPLWLSTFKADEVRNVAVIDATGKYAPLFEDTEQFHFIRSHPTLEAYRGANDKEVFAILQITDDLLRHPSAATLYSEKQVPAELIRLVNQMLSKQLETEKMASFNIPNLKEIIAESQVQFRVQTIKWSDDGTANESSAQVASIVGVLFTMIIYMFIMMYGAMVMQGVMEEKTNRIIEVIISSVRPIELMMGKIIGIGFVGLTQVFLWGILTFLLIAGGEFLFGAGASAVADPMQTGLATQTIDIGMQTTVGMQPHHSELFELLSTINLAEIGAFFILYFIGGYLLYAAIFAAIGSAVDSQEDTQQFMMPVTILILFAFYAGIYSMENPDGPLAFWCSLIPFTSPIVMMIRIPFEIPLWEKLLSAGLLYASAFVITWFSARIYRVGILMYGKKPSLKEMMKWIRYK